LNSVVFNQNPSKAKREADERPLVITDHGRESYVLMRYSDFQAHWPKSKSLLDALRDPNAVSDREFEPERVDFDNRDITF